MNTVTNTVKTITHCCLTWNAKPSSIWKDIKARRFNGYVSGDDKVIGSDLKRIEELANSVGYWKESGFLRKNLELKEPSKVVHDFEKLDFCSHRPLKVYFVTPTENGSSRTYSKWVPTRGQDEILAKLVYSVGAFMGLEEQAAHALSLRNYMLQYSFKRDIRLLCHYLTRALPTNMEPMGKMSRPRQLPRPWMTEKDINSCFVKIFSGSSLYKVPGLTDTSQLRLCTQREDRLGESAINSDERANWKRSLPRISEQMREALRCHSIDRAWTFTDSPKAGWEIELAHHFGNQELELIGVDGVPSLDGSSAEAAELVESGARIVVGHVNDPYYDVSEGVLAYQWAGGWHFTRRA
jgi:hypothetical protein